MRAYSLCVFDLEVNRDDLITHLMLADFPDDTHLARIMQWWEARLSPHTQHAALNFASLGTSIPTIES
eukprot:m.490147 g.490147  ORF g.490147 m.490147 type:complete len:68 (+) comp98620_c0_seq1:83-286(+)